MEDEVADEEGRPETAEPGDAGAPGGGEPGEGRLPIYRQPPLKRSTVSAGPEVAPPPPPREKPGRVKPWMVLLSLGLVLLIAALLVINATTNPGVSYQNVTIDSTSPDGGDTDISGLLMKPSAGTGGKVPGVIFAHGITGSKEWYIQMLKPLVDAGFVVLAIDLRGHGGSSGYCTFGYDEIADIYAAAEYLKSEVPEVDPEVVVAWGHSLGGITATRAGALQEDGTLSGVVAIYCWTSWKEALEDLLGPIDDLVARSWRFTTFSRHIDMDAPDFDTRYSVTAIVDDSRPPNYLLMLGSSDELASVERMEQILEKTTVSARRSGPEGQIKYSYTYGDFDSGTARRLYISDDDHVTELVSGVLTLETINWVRQVAGMPVDPGGGAPFVWGRVLGLMLLIAALALLAMGVMSLVRKRVFPGGGVITVRPAWGTVDGQGVWEVLIYALPVVAASLLAMPVAGLFGIGPLAPYAVVNELSIYFLARSIILFPLLVVVLGFSVAGAGGLRQVLSEGLRPSLSRWGKSIGYALIPLAVVLAITLPVGGWLHLPRVLAKYPAYFFLGVVCIGAGLWMEDYLFYKLAYPALEREEAGGRQWAALLARAGVLDLVLIAAMVPLMKGLGVSLFFQGFDIPLVLLMVLALPAFILLAELSIRLRRLTGGNLAFTVFVTALAVWFFMGPVGVRGF